MVLLYCAIADQNLCNIIVGLCAANEIKQEPYSNVSPFFLFTDKIAKHVLH